MVRFIALPFLEFRDPQEPRLPPPYFSNERPQEKVLNHTFVASNPAQTSGRDPNPLSIGLNAGSELSNFAGLPYCRLGQKILNFDRRSGEGNIMGNKLPGDVSREGHPGNSGLFLLARYYETMKNRIFHYLPFFFFVTTVPVFCLSPMIQYRDLVAGNGESGYKDGPFYSAEFNQPMGMALNADGSILYVADQKNNLIRAVLFKEKNNVITVAGSLNPGRTDGPLSLSSFNQPKNLAFLPDDCIAMFDQGNQLIRLIDLKGKTVSTLAGGGGKSKGKL
jgi:DNA-binding beta-propeller fold protein YncE